MAAIDQLAERARLVGAGLAGDVPSPCISVCRVDPATEWCEGCFRTLDEIAAWSRLHDEAKREVWRLIEQRLGRRQAETCAAAEPDASAHSGPP
jgi:predicted Fe-S protein YdhL (DUF1289 family)